MYIPRDYTIVAITVQNMVLDGWKFEVNDNGFIRKAIHEDDITFFDTEKDFRNWILEQALNY